MFEPSPYPSPTRSSGRLRGFLGLSLLLHANIAALIITLLSFNPGGCIPPVGRAVNPFEVALVPDTEARALAGRPARDPELERKEVLKKEEKKEEEKEKELKGQVVDVPPPAEEKQPDKARFLAEHDSKVAKETKGPQVPFKPGRLIPDRPIQPRLPSGPPPSPGAERELDRKVMKLAMRREPDLPKSDLPKDKSGRGDEPRLEKEEAARDPKLPKGVPGVPGAKGAGPGRKLTLKDLGLSDAELGRAVGSRVNDYLKDVEDGEQTLLNTRRWRFATFFNRVKRQVAENWHPDVVYRRRDPSGNVYGFRDRLTILRVRLTPQGRLKDLHLEKACGVGFLDDEAISAFKAAEPFPNPPPGLVDKESGLISFRFGFLFEISNRPSFRLFRYSD